MKLWRLVEIPLLLLILYFDLLVGCLMVRELFVCLQNNSNCILNVKRKFTKF